MKLTFSNSRDSIECFYNIKRGTIKVEGPRFLYRARYKPTEPMTIVATDEVPAWKDSTWQELSKLPLATSSNN